MNKERPIIERHDKSALIYRDERISYDQLLGRIDAYASLFSAGKGEICAIFSENRPEWIYAFYAVWKKGGVNSAVDFNASGDEVAAVLNDCRPKILFASENCARKLGRILPLLEEKPKILVFEELNRKAVIVEQQEQERPVSPLFLPADLDDTALILYTSGTTGSPKGVMLSFRSVLFNVGGVLATGMLTHDDVLLALFPFHHTVPLQGHIICPLYLGSTVVFIETLSSDEILRLFRTYKISLINGVPRLYSLFHKAIMKKIRSNILARILFLISKKAGNLELSRKLFRRVHDMFGGNVKVFLSGGAKLDKQITEDFWTLGIPMIEGYGLTEMGPLISYNLPDDWKAGSAGKPVPGVEVKIVDGEIVASSPGVMQGYYNNPDATAEILREGWIYTGDTGYMDEEGFLVLTGRKKEQIVLPNGKNLNPEEIEHEILGNSNIIREIAVTESAGKLRAYIYPDLDQINRFGIKNIREAVKWDVLDSYNRKTAAYKRILRFTIVPEELPKTPLGKIKRYLLDQSALGAAGDSGRISGPREGETPEYSVIKSYLAGETGQNIQPDMHFELDLGFDSMEMLELVLFIENRFGVTVKQEEIILYPTVRRIADFVADRLRAKEVQTGPEGRDDTDQNTIEVIPRIEAGFLMKIADVLLNPLITLLFGIRRVREFPGKAGRPMIIVPNHQSFLDPFILARSMPRHVLKNTFFLAKANVFRSFIGRFFASHTNSILLDLHKPTAAVVQAISSVLRRGKNVVIFPEGTRTFDGNLGSFKKTFAVLSKKFNIPVLPVVIEGAYESFPRTKIIPRPKRITVKYLPLFEPDGMSVPRIIGWVQGQIQITLGEKEKQR